MKEIPKLFYFFGHILEKNQHIHFQVHGHFSWSTFGIHLIRGLKTVRMHFKEIKPWNYYHEV
jgi:hypothetical protein